MKTGDKIEIFFEEHVVVLQGWLLLILLEGMIAAPLVGYWLSMRYPL